MSKSGKKTEDSKELKIVPGQRLFIIIAGKEAEFIVVRRARGEPGVRCWVLVPNGGIGAKKVMSEFEIRRQVVKVLE